MSTADAQAGPMGLPDGQSPDGQRDGDQLVQDLARFADVFGDLSDPEVMSQAWRCRLST